MGTDQNSVTLFSKLETEFSKLVDLYKLKYIFSEADKGFISKSYSTTPVVTDGKSVNIIKVSLMIWE